MNENEQPAGTDSESSDSLSNDSRGTGENGYTNPFIVRYKKDYLLDLPKSIAYMQGGLVTAVNIRQVRGGWQCLVKRTRRQNYEVAFLEADTWASLLDGMAEWTERGLWKWYPDKYPPHN